MAPPPDGSSIPPSEINRFEITQVYTHPSAKVDIVFIHGLNGHPQTTWTSKEKGTFWPSELLPTSLKSAQARILVYGYNADVYTFGGSGKGGPSSDMIHQHAQTLLKNLSTERISEETTTNPIIFVAHSLGGILTKRALELSHDLAPSPTTASLRSIYTSTYGILFLGTPHNGADAAQFGLILQSMVDALIPKKILSSHSQLIKTLQSNNETLQNINLKFLDIYPGRLRVCMVHESHMTDLKGSRGLIVDQGSASPLLPEVQYFGIEATHSGMCKFEGVGSPGFRNVSVTLKEWVQEAPAAIQRNWDDENALLQRQKESDVAKLLGVRSPPLSTSPFSPPTTTPAQQQQHSPDPSSPVNNNPNSNSNSTILLPPTIDMPPSQPLPPSPPPTHPPIEAPPPLFIRPSSFRPNNLFVGRSHELQLIHTLLFDPRRRAEGTSAVLIQSLPGGGKTHLAREYVYRYRDKFPGGVFWLRAKSEEELVEGFWDIGTKVNLRAVRDDDLPTSTSSRVPGSYGAGAGGGMGRHDRDREKQNPNEHFIHKVRHYFEAHCNWLLILDGVHFGPGILRRFIPDSPNTSLIYTSTEKSVLGDHHFMNPVLVKLPLLSAREARDLMVLELGLGLGGDGREGGDRGGREGVRREASRDEMRWCMELVQSMGFLPVVIHAVAQRLKATEEPLAKFARHYRDEPRLRGLATYMAVVEQLWDLKAIEALNLIRLVCFWGGEIPVEMLSLGLKGLDISVKARDPITGTSLNNTFKILNRFALIDRNDHEPQPPTLHSSQSTTSSKESTKSTTTSKTPQQTTLSTSIDVIHLHSVVQAFFIDTLHAEGTLPIWLDRSIRVFSTSYDSATTRILRKPHTGRLEDYLVYRTHGMKLSGHLAKYNSRHVTRGPVTETNIRPGITRRTSKSLTVEQKALMVDAQDLLDARLESIQEQINNRAPDTEGLTSDSRISEKVLKSSIFDRTSSSSSGGGGPDTPSSGDKICSNDSTWGPDPSKDAGGDEIIDSPEALTHSYLKHLEEAFQSGNGNGKVKKPHFPLPMPEDPGYDTDNEDRYHSRPPYIQDPASLGRGVRPIDRERERTLPVRAHTIEDPVPLRVRQPRSTRYRDTSGAFRAMISPKTQGTMKDVPLYSSPAVDPAAGNLYLGESPPAVSAGSLNLGLGGLGKGRRERDVSRGRMSSQSSAEAALNNLSRGSPPARGGGLVRERERRDSSNLGPRIGSGGVSGSKGEMKERGRVMTVPGMVSWAVPVTGVGPGVGVGGEGEDEVVGSYGSENGAVESLRRFPRGEVQMPPYPRSPAASLHGHSPPHNTTHDEGRGGGGAREGYTTQIYPAQMGYPPVEVLAENANVRRQHRAQTQQQQEHMSDSGYLNIQAHPHPQLRGENHYYAQTFTGSLPASMRDGPLHPSYLSSISLSKQNHSQQHIPQSSASSFMAPHLQDNERVDLMSLSSPNIRYPAPRDRERGEEFRFNPNATYYPGHPEFSYTDGAGSGYESLPMSRDASGQSVSSAGKRGGGREGGSRERSRERRISGADTEPLPEVGVWSPSPGSRSGSGGEGVMAGKGMGEIEGLRGMAGESGERKKSPRLEYARAALIERFDEWGRAVDASPFKPPPPPGAVQPQLQPRPQEMQQHQHQHQHHTQLLPYPLPSDYAEILPTPPPPSTTTLSSSKRPPQHPNPASYPAFLPHGHSQSLSGPHINHHAAAMTTQSSSRTTSPYPDYVSNPERGESRMSSPRLGAGGGGVAMSKQGSGSGGVAMGRQSSAQSAGGGVNMGIGVGGEKMEKSASAGSGSGGILVGGEGGRVVGFGELIVGAGEGCGDEERREDVGLGLGLDLGE